MTEYEIGSYRLDIGVNNCHGYKAHSEDIQSNFAIKVKYISLTYHMPCEKVFGKIFLF